jgi:tRNA 2-thiouridine synthesizing protein A
MSQHCACADRSPVDPEQTVDDIVRHHAGALELFKRAGINHCCGAHLSLREAAAAASAPLGALLLALNPPAPTQGPTDVVLDVRGLEPPQPMLRVLEALDRLGAGAALDVRLDRRPVFLYPQLEDRGFAHDTSEPAPGLVRVLVRHRRV